MSQKIDDYKERKKMTLDNMSYSIQRLDLLIISISGGGIYICLETSKFLIEQKKLIMAPIIFPALLFTIAIIANLVSQYTGYLSNEYDHNMCDLEIKSDGIEDEVSIAESKRLDTKSALFDNITSYLNIASLSLLIAGLIFLIVFYYNITF